MKERYSNLEEIESWLNGKMTSSEKIEFQNKMDADPSLKEEVKEVKALEQGIIHANQKSIRSQLNQVEDELSNENFFESQKNEEVKVVSIDKNKSKKSIFPLLAIAASVLLLVAAGTFLFNSNPGTSFNEQDFSIAFQNSYKPDSKEVYTILDRLEAKGFSDEEKENKAQLAAALSLYSESKFNEALPALSQFVRDNPNNKNAKLYLGLTLLETSKYAKASEILKTLANDVKFEKRDMSSWYLALSYLKIEKGGKVKDAKVILKELQKTIYKQQASDLLKLIE